MSDSRTSEPSPTGSESPAFVRAVADLSATRSVKTTRPIYNTQGIKLLEGGATVDKSLYDRLVSHRLSVPLDECIDIASKVDDAALRKAVRQSTERWPFFAGVVASTTKGRPVMEALAAIRLPTSAALYLTLARESRPALYAHSVQMALLSARLALDAGADRSGASDAAAAGLLHDLGMLHIEPGLLDSSDRLSGDELKPVYVHPLTTSMLVERFAAYSKDVVRAIVEHHERLDGSGYPRGLSADATSPLGRILALAEVVTAMFDGQRRFPEQRVSLLLRMNPRRYDPVHVAAVQRLLAATPPVGAESIASDSLVERLLQLTAVLSLWRDSFEAMGHELEGAPRELLDSVNEQNETLQRMLYEAGVTPDQLSAIAGQVGDDAAFRIELWTLAEELLWQLHAAANQLKRRWQAADKDRPHPQALDTWFAAVAALDSTPST